jgi:hypothetical protein
MLAMIYVAMEYAAARSMVASGGGGHEVVYPIFNFSSAPTSIIERGTH